MSPNRINIIGAGIIGLATALRLRQRFPDAEIAVLEKEPAVAQHQSSHNSGVLHAGIYYKPGSIKARLAVRGIRQMVEFCRENAIPHEICGKIVVASNEQERLRLNELFERGKMNGLRGLELLGPEQMKEIEPFVTGQAAIRVPEEGIVDYSKVCASLATKSNSRIATGARVTRLRRLEREWIAYTPVGEFRSDLLINCAGLHCDQVSALAGIKREVRIVPFRGEYFKIKPERQYLVRNLIYPVPDPQFPFLGVHFTRLIAGGVEAGPNAVLALAREGYRKYDVDLMDLADAAGYRGLWAFIRKYPRMCFDELRRSFSKEMFCTSLQKLVPSIAVSDLQPGGAGVRAQAITPSGDLLQDFCIRKQANAVHVLNAPSPGATASLAIAEEIVNQIEFE